jgi:hypothetical protein
LAVDPEVERQIAAAAARGAASLSAGKRLDEVLRAFREDDQFGAIASMLALMRTVDGIGLATAKELVDSACGGVRFPHLGLDELRHLAYVVRLPDASLWWWIESHLRGAIISGRPWKLFQRDVPEVPRSVHYFDAATPDPKRAGSMYGDGLSFDGICNDLRAAARAPGWSDELTIARDEPDLILVHFLRVVDASQCR